MSKDSDGIRFLFYALFAGGALVVYSVKKIKHKTKLKSLSRQLISAASAGTVELEAVSWPLRSWMHSLDGKKIVYRSIIIKKKMGSGKNARYEKVWEKNSSAPFLAFDQTGFVVVEPSTGLDKSLLVEESLEKKYDYNAVPAEGLESFNEFYDHSVPGLRASCGKKGLFSILFGPSYYIFEKCIPVGSPLLIHGALYPDDSARFIHVEGDLKSFKDKVTKVFKSKNVLKAIFDKNKDGIVDSAELKRGFQGALKTGLKNELSISNIKTHGNPDEKVYGSIRVDHQGDLHLYCTFEEQLLNTKPYIYNWLGLITGAAIIAAIVAFFVHELMN